MNSRSTRRRFLKTTALGLVGWSLDPSASPGAAAASSEPGDAVTVIDTHTHFYDPTRPESVPWPPKEDRLLYRRVLPDDYRALRQPRRVTGTVVVEASPWVEDNQWILDLAARDHLIVGYVGNLLFGANEFRDHLKRFAANRLFRGLRINAGQLKQGIKQSQFRADLELLAARDLSLDLVGDPSMLRDVAQLARDFPRLRLVIDHLAGVRIDGKTVDLHWRQGMQQAGKEHNVCCKVSGLVEGTGRSDGTAPRDVGFYQPVLEVVWDVFGPDRLIYGSNWPVSERFASCATVQGIVNDYFAPKGRRVLAKVFSLNAQKVYHRLRHASPD